jgi:hypothetical protein
MEATFVEGQGPQGAVVPWMDGLQGAVVERVTISNHHTLRLQLTNPITNTILNFWGTTTET